MRQPKEVIFMAKQTERLMKQGNGVTIVIF